MLYPLRYPIMLYPLRYPKMLYPLSYPIMLYPLCYPIMLYPLLHYINRSIRVLGLFVTEMDFGPNLLNCSGARPKSAIQKSIFHPDRKHAKQNSATENRV